ncbi:MAG: putative universal stress protein [Verrucomicrobia bacterium ADurb.Bin345]|nr:MAG: putative universal stress protein [Verrucomicrobia bacterium ADurb.Bin345]
MTPVPAPYGPFKRILFCTDFSENADFAFDFALEQARHSPECMLYLLHVVPEPDAQFWRTYVDEVENVEDKGRKDMEERIQEAYASRVPAGLKFQVELRTGIDHQQILEFAEEKKVDLLIIGRQGSSSIGKVFFGAVTEKVVRKSRCPVLVVPLSFEVREAG